MTKRYERKLCMLSLASRSGLRKPRFRSAAPADPRHAPLCRAVKDIRNRLFRLFALAGIGLYCASGLAQEELSQQRWWLLETEHFQILSQLSSRRTAEAATELEIWRDAVGRLISRSDGLPPANVPNLVFLFDDHQDYQHFTLQQDAGFHLPTPRANYMAMSMREDLAWRQGLHHYVHFLMRNFIDLRMPRWYEEGLAGYFSRIEVDGAELWLPGYSSATNERMAELSQELAMERLLYQDAALASPRVIQIANLKSEALLTYLRHGHEEGFADWRGPLQSYLDYLLDGRNPRFAFDRSFGIRSQQLDDELHDYLLNTRADGRPVRVSSPRTDYGFEPVAAETDYIAIQLGELALNAGRFEVAEIFFRGLTEQDSPIARAWSGLGDSIRFQDETLRESDQRIAGYFEHALALAPDNPDILLDFGEYWEAELEDCDNEWAPARASERLAAALRAFEKVIVMHPDNPEANLAMGEIYLFDEYDWRSGVQYQRRAFELLPADTFIMEQAVKYAIEAERFEEAERLIAELAQPLHFWGEPDWVSDLRLRLLNKRRGTDYDLCAND